MTSYLKTPIIKSMGKKVVHPYHYSAEKNLIQRLLDIGLPVGLFYLYFQFYNLGKFTPSEMVKTTGLVSISLLAITLLSGPAARFLPFLDILKAHRKFWGIGSFLFLAAHIILVYIFYFKFSLYKFIDPANPKAVGLTYGLLATGVLLVVTLTSNRKALMGLDPKVWKFIQTTSYLALVLAVAHFYFVEQVNGVFVIKGLAGQITFYFALAVILVRLLVLFLPQKRR
ncbi:MAG: hypothetical protein US98_C0033G0002 [Parcubacteria group bacterium GW2011_GWC1_38_6]|nr:MAG: hypothetical protein US98_C0033G0002 [Parcubacteria group bacterium GW2011_GWC1_38_6]